jgi:hypothetical protein
MTVLSKKNHQVLNFIGTIPVVERDLITTWLWENVGGDHAWTWMDLGVAVGELGLGPNGRKAK